MRKLFPVLVLLTALCSCLPDEDRCRYGQLSIDNVNKHTYAVDSFHVSVYDSVTLYSLDTLYLNDGTWMFADVIPNDCKDSGSILFNRADGSTVAMQFNKSTGYNPYMYSPTYLILHSPSLDGYPTPCNSQMQYVYTEGEEVKINLRGYEMRPKLRRYWELTLKRI